MVSLALAEIDVSRAEVEITSAGHPPGMLLVDKGEVEELLLSSLPLGHRWPELPPAVAGGSDPASRLLLYSDGLVEARTSGGEPFGLRDAARGAAGAQGSPGRDVDPLRCLQPSIATSAGNRSPTDLTAPTGRAPPHCGPTR